MWQDFFKTLLKDRCIFPKDMKDGDQNLKQDDRTHQENQTLLYVFPKSVTEIRKILMYANQHHIGIIPQGGNTNRVASAVSLDSPLISKMPSITMNLRNLNKIPYFSSYDRIGVFESGCTLDQLKNRCAKDNLDFPLDLAPKERAQLGGSLANASGGLSVVSYGSLASNTIGLEVVLANGQVLNMLQYTIKNNMGFNMFPLFIGSMGTLGIITKASIKLKSLTHTRTECFGFLTFSEVIKFVHFLGKSHQSHQSHRMVSQQSHRMVSQQSQLATWSSIKAIEFMDENTLNLTQIPKQYLQYLYKRGSSDPIKYMVILDSVDTDASYPNQDLSNQGLSNQDLSNQDLWKKHVLNPIPDIWVYRKSIPRQGKEKFIQGLHTDFSLPLIHMESFIFLTKNIIQSLSKTLYPVYFGHLGDGNIHFNVYSNKQSDQVYFQKIFDFCAQIIQKNQGSLSAEHGIGRTNQHIARYIPSNQQQYMQKMKQVFDPEGILNPGIFYFNH